MRPIHLDRERVVRMNLTPMIDVVFLLLIFFLCVSQLQKAESETVVELPKSESADRDGEASPEEWLLELTAAGRLEALGNPVDEATLVLWIREWRVEHGPPRVRLRADRGIAYAQLEAWLAILARENVPHVRIQVDPETANDGDGPGKAGPLRDRSATVGQPKP